MKKTTPVLVCTMAVYLVVMFAAGPVYSQNWSTSGNYLYGSEKIGGLYNGEDVTINIIAEGDTVYRFDPTGSDDPPNIIGGFYGNWVTSGAKGATISGGGTSGGENAVTDSHCTVGGGLNNVAGNNSGTVYDANYATVCGGYSNEAGGQYSTVSGGYSNEATASRSTIAGGYSNLIYQEAPSATIGGGDNNTVGSAGWYSVIGGGRDNEAGAWNSTICGGYSNNTSAQYATISGGNDNTASGDTSFVGGGYSNAASGTNATIAGGNDNTASGYRSSICGGYKNYAYGSHATIAGGYNNWANDYSTVGGGYYNYATGYYATTPGGYFNTATSYAFAAGTRAYADDTGCFIWADNSTDDHSVRCAGTNSVNFRVNGQFWIGHTDPVFQSGRKINTSTGGYLSTGGAWVDSSSITNKMDFEQVNTADILETVRDLPLSEWSYIEDPSGVRHMGPMAEDFYYMFGLGNDAESIASLDTAGVALAAIQALDREYQENSIIIAQLRRNVRQLNEENKDLESKLVAINNLQERVAQLETEHEKNSVNHATLPIAVPIAFMFLSILAIAYALNLRRKYLIH